MMKRWFKLKFYVSGLDRFLQMYRTQHPRLSASQRAEKEKYERLNEQRDNPTISVPKTSFWENF